MTDPASPNMVIFLDIDGPMIPTSMFLVDPHASIKRSMPPTTVAVLTELCVRTKAKIVFNTTHSRSIPSHGTMDEDIAGALVRHGFDAKHLHASDRHTRYPDISRDQAVREWLARHPEVTKWVALDDAKFTDDPRLILVDPDSGLTLRHLELAIEKLGGKAPLILI